MSEANFEKYRQPWETGPHWELKREFLEKYQNDFEIDRLLCLAQAYSNVELMNCSYPAPVMLQVHELSKSLVGWRRFHESSQDTLSKGKRKSRLINDRKFKFVKFCSAKETESCEENSEITPESSKDVKNEPVTPSPSSEVSCTYLQIINSSTDEDLISKNLKALSNDDIISLQHLSRLGRKFIINQSKFAYAALAQAANSLNFTKEISFKVDEVPNCPAHARMYNCDIHWKSILISSAKGTSMKISKTNASTIVMDYFLTSSNFKSQELQLENLMKEEDDISNVKELITKPKLSKTKKKNLIAVKDYIQSENPESESILSQMGVNPLKTKKSNNFPGPFSLNERLFTNSVTQQFVLVDKSAVVSFQEGPSSVLASSASFCRKRYSCPVEVVKEPPNALFSATVLIDDQIITTATGNSKTEAKAVVAFKALEQMRKNFYVLKVKNEAMEDGFVVNRDQMMQVEVSKNALSNDNLGFKMLKMMGWGGGGIGKKSGIVEPIVAQERKFGQGLGYSDARNAEICFKQRIDALLKDFSNSNTTSDLIFSTDFSKGERKIIHNVAIRFDLNTSSRGMGPNRQIYVKKKISIANLLNLILEAGGSTHKYDMFDQSS